MPDRRRLFMSENTFELKTTNFEKKLFLKKTTPRKFIAWLNDFVMSPRFVIPLLHGIDGQYSLAFMNPKISYLAICPHPIDDSGRAPFIFPWVLVGIFNKDNADGSTSVGVGKIEAVKIKTFKVSKRTQVTISTEYKLIEDVYLPVLLEEISKAYPKSTLSDTPPEIPATQAKTEPGRPKDDPFEFLKNPNFHFPQEGTYQDRVGYTHVEVDYIIIKSKPGYEGVIDSGIERIQEFAKDLEQPLLDQQRDGEPSPNAAREEWFKYYYQCRKRKGPRVIHQYVAHKLRLSCGHERQEYAKWLAENKDEQNT
jgi:hypothetical protein